MEKYEHCKLLSRQFTCLLLLPCLVVGGKKRVYEDVLNLFLG
jgi:hypothetical protein